MAHKTSEELFEMIALAKKKVNVGGYYFHYKHPEQLYTLVDLIIIEASDEVGVLYRAEYPELKGIIFMRPIMDFLSIIEKDGVQVARFTYVNNKI